MKDVTKLTKFYKEKVDEIELKLDICSFPYLKVGMNLPGFHCLETYFHVISYRGCFTKLTNYVICWFISSESHIFMAYLHILVKYVMVILKLKCKHIG